MDFADGNAMMDSMGYDLDNGFEPQTRARSNTWPCPRPDSFPEAAAGAVGGPGSAGPKEPGCSESGGTPPQQPSSLLPVKKNSSRRNAWGNLSYADLITQAITSAPDKRLTLSQIYEWMVQNVPYFKDKGDSNSSAGWKNSIRHNLSLHNRFMRVQNEGTGKSSWWMINPDAKPGKSARRRATSMETSKFEKRRGRVKKKVEALRNGSLQADATPSPSSSVSEGLDLFPDSPLHPASSFQLSPDFRPRASSNASSCGRLSPIPAVLGESEWTPNYASTYSPEQLAGSLAETMKLVPAAYQMYQTSPSQQQQQQQPPSQQQQQQQSQAQPQQQPPQQQQPQQSGPPPSYFEAQYQRNNSLRTSSSPYGLPPTPQSNSQQRCPLHRLQPCACTQMQNLNINMSPSYQPEPSPSLTSQQQSMQQYLLQQQQTDQSQTQQQPQTLPQQQQTPQTRQQQTTQPNPVSSGNSPPDSPIPSTMMGQLMGALNNTALLDDLNINIETLHGFDCDIDEVIKHELLINGTLDINFQQPNVLPHAALPNVPTTDSTGIVDQLVDTTTAAVAAHHQATAQAAAAAAAVSNVAGVASSNAASAAAVYASTNAATPAASPSWVH